MYKICFYVPVDHAEKVKNSLFASGAGKFRNYSHCAWQVLGEGQFLPLNGSHPQKGEHGQLEKVAEYKVEMICEERYLTAVIEALKTHHPYEEPAYQIWEIMT